MTVRLPRPGPGIGRELTVPQELACALRILAREGWRENLSGHITVADRRRRHVVQPVGHLVGRGARLRHPAPRRRRRDRRRRMGRHSRGVPAHRAAPRPRRRDRHRAQPSLLRDAARGDGRDAPPWCTRTRASSTASSRSSTSTRASRTRDEGQVARRAGRRRERHPARAPRRDRDRADDRARRATRPRRSSACAASPTTSSPPAAAPTRSRPSSARELKPLLRQNTPPAYWDGAVRLLLARRARGADSEPGHLARRPGEQRD